MSYIPYRTGLTTIILLLHRICRLLLKYDEVLRVIIPSDKWHYVDDLKEACEAFTHNIYNPRPSNEA